MKISMKKAINLMILVLAVTFIFSNVNVAKAARISSKSYALMVGEDVQLTIIGSTKTVKWTSSNKKVVTVDKKGQVKAKGIGEATVTAKAGKQVYYCYITVTKPASGYIVPTDSSSGTNPGPGNDNGSGSGSDNGSGSGSGNGSGKDTGSPTYITKSNYDKLSNNITYEEAVKIIGIDGSLTKTEGDSTTHVTKTYVWYGKDSSSTATVVFVDGKLSSKTQKSLQ